MNNLLKNQNKNLYNKVNIILSFNEIREKFKSQVLEALRYIQKKEIELWKTISFLQKNWNFSKLIQKKWEILVQPFSIILWNKTYFISWCIKPWKKSIFSEETDLLTLPIIEYNWNFENDKKLWLVSLDDFKTYYATPTEVYSILNQENPMSDTLPNLVDILFGIESLLMWNETKSVVFEKKYIVDFYNKEIESIFINKNEKHWLNCSCSIHQHSEEEKKFIKKFNSVSENKDFLLEDTELPSFI